MCGRKVREHPFVGHELFFDFPRGCATDPKSKVAIRFRETLRLARGAVIVPRIDCGFGDVVSGTMVFIKGIVASAITFIAIVVVVKLDVLVISSVDMGSQIVRLWLRAFTSSSEPLSLACLRSGLLLVDGG